MELTGVAPIDSLITLLISSLTLAISLAFRQFTQFLVSYPQITLLLVTILSVYLLTKMLVRTLKFFVNTVIRIIKLVLVIGLIVTLVGIYNNVSPLKLISSGDVRFISKQFKFTGELIYNYLKQIFHRLANWDGNTDDISQLLDNLSVNGGGVYSLKNSFVQWLNTIGAHYN